VINAGINLSKLFRAYPEIWC